jgi:hypothetical protein
MQSSWSLKMGHVNIGVHLFSPHFDTDIGLLLRSLSFNLAASIQEKVNIVFVTPDAPESFASSLELPKWGKPICISLFKVMRKISHDTHDQSSLFFDLVKTVNFGPRDWFSPSLKTFFYHRENQLIGFVQLFDKLNKELLLARISMYVFLFATYWYVSHGGLLLHGAAMAMNQNGYLFLGKGGAGKSTTAALSASVGVSVLSDDLAFVIMQGLDGYELAAAPGQTSRYSTDPLLRPQLKGVFLLFKDTQDKIVPVSQLVTANAIFRSFEWNHWVDHMPPTALTLAFQTTCDIARHIPGYELHFRKSPDFWKLIDEQFPE